MLERYSITTKSEELTERFSVDVPEAYTPRYNAAPSQLLPVITHESPQGISFFYWGMAPEWAKNKTISERIINVRAEQIPEKPVILKNLKKRRCIIPADGFYDWKKVGKKTMIPYRFTLPDKGPFSMAGLWEEYDDDEGNYFHTFTIVTLPASEIVRPVSERMPAILDKTGELLWLSAQSSEEELLAMLMSNPVNTLTGYTVSPRINSTQPDDPTLIISVPPADQFGNLTLFN